MRCVVSLCRIISPRRITAALHAARFIALSGCDTRFICCAWRSCCTLHRIVWLRHTAHASSAARGDRQDRHRAIKSSLCCVVLLVLRRCCIASCKLHASSAACVVSLHCILRPQRVGNPKLIRWSHQQACRSQSLVASSSSMASSSLALSSSSEVTSSSLAAPSSAEALEKRELLVGTRKACIVGCRKSCTAGASLCSLGRPAPCRLPPASWRALLFIEPLGRGIVRRLRMIKGRYGADGNDF